MKHYVPRIGSATFGVCVRLRMDLKTALQPVELHGATDASACDAHLLAQQASAVIMERTELHAQQRADHTRAQQIEFRHDVGSGPLLCTSLHGPFDV